MNGRTPDVAWARELVAYISADCAREEWLRIGMALKAGIGAHGWPVFEEWSRSAPDRFDAADCRRAWDSLEPDGGVGWGTLVQRARASGWEPPAAETVQTQQWTIRELDGTPVAIHYRRTLPNGDKRTWWGQPDGTKGLGGRKAKTLPLYGIERLAGTTAKVICIVEGEKAADALRAAEPTVLVLGTVTGASGHPEAAVLKPVADAGLPVYLWSDADLDGAGIRHMERVAEQLIEAGGEAPSIIKWEGAPPKGDAADWVDAHRFPTFETLTTENSVVFMPKPKRRRKPPAKAPKAASGERPVIVATPGERGRWTREAVAALVAAGPRNDRESLYASARSVFETGENAGDLLFLREAPPPAPEAAVQTPEGTLLYAPATVTAVQSQLDTSVRWYVVRRTRGGDTEEVPGEIGRGDVELVIERYRHDCLDRNRPRLRVLRGIVDAPTLRVDGTLIDKPGYDEASGLYANFDPDDWPSIPKNPTRDDARAAAERLYDLVEETPFASPVHRSVWLAALLTVVARTYAAGNVPLFAFSANVPGAGKGTLVDLVAEIATGRSATKWSPVGGRRTDAEPEERKRLMAVALSGLRVMCIDNIKAGDPLGTPALDGALTSGEDERFGHIGDRVLKESRHTEVPWLCVVMATGNNLTVVGDMGRRAVLCRLESSLEDPETRQFKRHPKLLQHVRRNRRTLLIAALTILLAHKRAVEAGEPDTLLPRVNSFGGWSDRIRSAVWWADPKNVDPWDGNRELKETAQPEQAEMLALLEAWHIVFGSSEVLTRDIDRACREGGEDYKDDLAEAVSNLSLAPPRGTAAVNSRSLGQWLKAHSGRPGPYRLCEGDKYRGQTRWFVEKINTGAASEKAEPSDYVPSPEAEQAIRDLLADFPDEFVVQDVTVGKGALHDCLLQVHNDDRLISLRYVYQDGHQLGEYLQNATNIVDAVKQVYRGLDEDTEAAGWLPHIVSVLAWAADHKRPAGPAYEQAKARFNSMGMGTATLREEIALSYLLKAARRCGSVEADSEVLARRAVELLVVDQNWDRQFAAGVESAIKELLGLKELHGYPYATNYTGGDQYSDQIEIW